MTTLPLESRDRLFSYNSQNAGFVYFVRTDLLWYNLQYKINARVNL